ncbi:hypothetical protein FNV43_RR20349 [Rhamnella rubrinervis]|uniref:Leucine-rich repeat-containing N-terminal plant-type domain-containing protein n=1 Tax=Rhamnella rubrinervis TaxID=2594499 RepID=A0A8K0GUH8_9ROSA|nr:hypothetical protein FNV43_RR20349 [Rhamnella rubrinervis]
MQIKNRINQGRYSEWNQNTTNPCQWYGVSCKSNRVTAIILRQNYINGEIFANFSALTALSYLDLSENTLSGGIPQDLSQCKSLKYLNLSHNIIEGKLNLSGLNQLEVLDLSVNRFHDNIQLSFPEICDKLIVANLSLNNFAGRIDKCFEGCLNLQYLDLSVNSLSGKIWDGFGRLIEFSMSENYLSGTLSPSIFTQNCSLQVLDISDNEFGGEVPGNISNCRNLSILQLFGNNFTGKIPSDIGKISSLEALVLGNNNFSREIPDTLLSLNKLKLLDLSRNKFGGDVQEIFGKFKQVKFLILNGNSYTSGMNSSGILNLHNISRLDLSFNEFSGPLPVKVSQLLNLEFFILAYNHFSGTIPAEFGNLPSLQALDLSFNNLTGSIPSSLGNLSSILWLMLANNRLTGPIPPELGNCSSLLWLNLANNKLSGKIPSELTNIGKNPTPTFELNTLKNDHINNFGQCLTMRRWIPHDYPPFSFLYITLTRKSCITKWDQLVKGIGTYPLCSTPGSAERTIQISGYLQLGGNFLSDELPPEIMKHFSMFHLGVNELHGELPPDIGNLPLMVFNISMNKLSGAIPEEIGKAECLRNLDISYNNFSGTFPISFNNLTELSKFNISFNPFLSGKIPSTGQLATFDRESYLGDPLLDLPDFIKNSSDKPYMKPIEKPEIKLEKTEKLTDSSAYWVFVVLTAAFFHIASFYLSYTKLSF